MPVKTLAVFSLLWVVLAGSATTTELAERDEADPHSSPAVSLIRLVASCGEFNGKQVMTTGFAMFEFENFKVRPSAELARYDPASCSWLTAGEDGIPDDELRSLKDSGRTFVTIEARVGCSKPLYAGYLDQIQLIVELETAEVFWTTDPTMRAGMKGDPE